MTLSKEEAEFILAPHKLRLQNCIESAWNDLHRLKEYLPHIVTPRTRANLMHDFMVSHARNEFDGVKNVRLCDMNGLFLLILEERINIKFKKLNDDKMPSNIPTQQNDFFMQQLDLPGIESANNLIAGYELNTLATDLHEITITCPMGNRNEWYINLGYSAGINNVIDITSPNKPDLPIRVSEKHKKVAKESNV